MELNIIENPNKWALPEKTDSANDTDDNFDLKVDKIIERNLKAFRILSGL